MTAARKAVVRVGMVGMGVRYLVAGSRAGPCRLGRLDVAPSQLLSSGGGEWLSAAKTLLSM